MGGRLEYRVRQLPSVLACSVGDDLVVLVDPDGDPEVVRAGIRAILDSEGSSLAVRVLGGREVPTISLAARVLRSRPVVAARARPVLAATLAGTLLAAASGLFVAVTGPDVTPEPSGRPPVAAEPSAGSPGSSGPPPAITSDDPVDRLLAIAATSAVQPSGSGSFSGIERSGTARRRSATEDHVQGGGPGDDGPGDGGPGAGGAGGEGSTASGPPGERRGWSEAWRLSHGPDRGQSCGSAEAAAHSQGFQKGKGHQSSNGWHLGHCDPP